MSFFSEKRGIGSHVYNISITFQGCKIKSFCQCCFDIRLSSRYVSCIFAQVYFCLFRTIVFVVEILVVQEPSRSLVIMFVDHRNTQFVRQSPSFHVVCTLIERSHCTDNNHFRIFFFDGIEDHREAFFEDISDKIFISDTDVFQIERFRMPGFGTYLSPLCLLSVTVCPFYQIKNILNISSHFAHRDTTLLSSSQVAVTGRVLARNTGRQHWKRFRTNIFAKLEIFKITQSHALMVSPKVTLCFSCFQRTYCIFPLINVFQAITMSHTATGETDETGMNISQHLSQIFAKPVLTSFKCILRE